MKVKPTLSLTTTTTQRFALVAKVESSLRKSFSTTIPVRTPQKESFFNVLIKFATKRMRIPVPLITPQPIFDGNKSFLRAMREAELESWNANSRISAA